MWFGVCPEFTGLTGVVWSLATVHKAYWYRLEFVQSSQDLLVWSGVCPEFTRPSGVVWRFHFSVMWYVVHIAKWVYQESRNSHCSAGWSRIHTVQRGGQEFKPLCKRQSGGMELRQMEKAVEDSLSG